MKGKRNHLLLLKRKKKAKVGGLTTWLSLWFRQGQALRVFEKQFLFNDFSEVKILFQKTLTNRHRPPE